MLTGSRETVDQDIVDLHVGLEALVVLLEGWRRRHLVKTLAIDRVD